jgi:hypothetical protein
MRVPWRTLQRAASTLVSALSFSYPIWAQPPQPAQQVALNKPTIAQIRQFKIAPQSFRELEKRFDARLESLSPDPNEPSDLLGETRGIYVEGCGVIFTAAVSLVKAPELNPFLREVPKERADHVHKLRVDRLPLLKKAMDEMLHNMAMTYMTVPPDQQMVVAVRLYYASWEKTDGMPAQIMMRGTRAGVPTGDITVEID